MIAYNHTLIRNISIVKKSKQWFSKQLISTEQLSIVLKKYKTEFYSPNLFIKIGLFIFTLFAIFSAYGFYISMFIIGQYIAGYFAFSCFLFSVICVCALEFFIKNNNLYNAGVDECILYSALGFSFVGIGIMIKYDFNLFDNKTLFLSILTVPFFIASIVRYADKLVTLALGICFYFIFFLTLLKLGDVAKLIMPFALMIVSVLVYLASKKYKQLESFHYLNKCFIVIECIALVVFYLAGNYYVIRESSIAYFGLKLNKGEDIPLAFLFYILTAIVPLVYVYYGLKNKDKLLLWIGLILIVIAALTFKNYFSLGHPEIILTLSGFIMIVIAYVSIRILKTPKYGITFEEEPDEDNFLKSNAEAMMIAQNFGQNEQTSSDTKFGGGNFGGAGSGGNF